MPHIERKNPIVFGGGQRSPGVTEGQTLKTVLTQYLEVGSLDEFHTLYMPHIERKNAIVFGEGQRSSGVTGGQTFKILTQYLEMCYGKRKNAIFFGAGQRSFGVTGG
ncbi:hypothetical protein HOLleu_01665 [Holothuria leucospilota]|uniref:Uncharacterized protein n=1 Tax=Holothuria leucospilota TaxID=206669 RepID=A0A9Q1CQR0_HOLLE|nr:hypothetical protein HOLleu_01665 [Holothuria leucospilota]